MLLRQYHGTIDSLWYFLIPGYLIQDLENVGKALTALIKLFSRLIWVKSLLITVNCVQRRELYAKNLFHLWTSFMKIIIYKWKNTDKFINGAITFNILITIKSNRELCKVCPFVGLWMKTIMNKWSINSKLFYAKIADEFINQLTLE